MRITSCPLYLITSEVLELIKIVKLSQKGIPPVAGGSLDQTRWFISATDFVMAELDFWDRSKQRLF